MPMTNKEKSRMAFTGNVRKRAPFLSLYPNKKKGKATMADVSQRKCKDGIGIKTTLLSRNVYPK